MARKNRIGLTFRGFEEYAEKIDRLNGDLDNTVKKALQASFDHVTPKAEAAINRHVQTGETKTALKRSETVQWEGRKAYIKVGFEIPKGMPSIFLMYGTPRMKKDTKLYNAIYGTKTQKEIKQIQKEIFEEEFRRVMG